MAYRKFEADLGPTKGFKAADFIVNYMAGEFAVLMQSVILQNSKFTFSACLVYSYTRCDRKVIL